MQTWAVHVYAQSRAPLQPFSRRTPGRHRSQSAPHQQAAPQTGDARASHRACATHATGCASRGMRTQREGLCGLWPKSTRSLSVGLNATSAMDGIDGKTLRTAPRWRLAIELTGCVRHLELTTAAKVESILAARAAGFSVDLFCVLEECSQHESDAVNNGSLSNFMSAVRHIKLAVANCTLVSQSDSVIGAKGKLKPRYTPKGYPYCHFSRVSVDHMIAQARKLQQVGGMRRDFSRQLGHRYDLVWRQRPDWVSRGLDWNSVRRLLLCDGTRQCHSSSAEGADFAVPQVCVDGAHTDIEAILTPEAADHYDSLVDRIPSLYREAGHYMHNPESCLDAHMRTGARRFRHYVQNGWILYGCSPECFHTPGSAACRSVISGTRLKTIRNLTQCGLPRVHRGGMASFAFRGPCSKNRGNATWDPPLAIAMRSTFV